MTKTRDLANLIADSKVGPSEIDTTGTYNMNALQVGGTTVIDSSRNATFTTVGTPAGSAAAPAYTFSTDTNTGMFKRGTDQIGFSAGGTEMLALTSTGIFADKLGNKSTGSGLTLDAAGSIILDADSGEIQLKDGTVEFGQLAKSSSDFRINHAIQDGSIVFRGNDNGSIISALTLDMSEAGRAIFNAGLLSNNTNDIRKIQITSQYDTSSFLRLHPSATTNSGGFTNMFFGTSTVSNFGVAIGGVREGTDGTPTFAIRMHNDSIVGTKVLTILNSGNVGIAVPDPEAKLHVNGAAIIGSQNNASTTPIAGLHILDQTYSTWNSTLSKNQVALRVETYYSGSNSHARAVGDYGGGIGFNHLGGHSTTHDENLHCWIGPRVTSTAGHEKSALAFATNDVTTDEDSGITERMVIMPNGNVGIGEPSPNQPLVVKKATDGAVIVANTAQAGGQGIGFFTDTANNRVGVFNNSSTTLDMVFNTGGTATSGEAMRIDNATGIVGIRTSSIAGVADSTGVQALQLGGTHLIHYDEDAAGTSSFSNNVYWNGSQNTTVFSGKASQIYMESGNIIFRNSDDNHGVGAQVTNFHERLRINSEGNVGIGISPQVLLHVQAGSTGNGTVRIGGGAGLQISHDNSSNTVQTIESLYRTTSADAHLQIKTGYLKVFTGISGAEAVKIDTTQTVWNGGNQSYNDNYRVYAHVENVSSLFNNTTNGQTQTITVNNHLPYQHVLPVVVAFTYGGNGAISYSKTLLVENGFNNIMIEQLATNDSDGGSILASVGFNATGSYNNRRLQITATPGSSYSMNQWNCSVYYGAAWH